MKIRFNLLNIIICIFLVLAVSACGHKSEGIFTPTRFDWSGGSGRVSISCEKVTVSGGEAVAEITFSSPNYEYVRVEDEKIFGDHTDKTSTFSVPVELDTDMELVGCTTAMSKPHEISYTIYISIDDKYSSGEVDEASSELCEKVNDSRISENANADLTAPDIAGLSYKYSMKLDYAKCFAVHYYINESDINGVSGNTYRLISVLDGRKYLIVPEGCAVLDDLSKEITVLKQPITHVYLAATSAMSLFDVLDETSLIRYTGTDISGWDIEAPREAIESGKMTFAGKYSAPDYEMLIDGGCDLAIESTMILHSPETKEQLEKVGIPVFIDWSSYESSALGRTEWVKLYGALTGHEAEAETFFKNEVLRSGIAEGFEKTGKTVAFFYFNSRGLAVIRNSDDYIPKMIRDGGGEYVFDGLKERVDRISADISMEEFYQAAVDADYIIYNGNIDSTVEAIEDLVAKNELLSGFKAVKDADVYMVDGKFYQSTDTVSEFARDVHIMLSGESGEMRFLKKMN